MTGREAVPPGRSWVIRLADRLGAIQGWRRFLAAAGFGAVLTAAMPPVDVTPAVFVAFTGLTWLLDGATGKRQAFFIGWSFGLGHFVTGLYWIANALVVDGLDFAWMIPFAMFGLPSYLAIYPGLAALATRLSRTKGIARIIFFACAWTLAEWLRGVALTGFSWNPTGLVWSNALPILQSLSIIGILGLGFITVLVASMPALLPSCAPPSWRWGPVAAGLVLLAALWGAGEWRLAQGQTDLVPNVRLRLVQPAIPQRDKWVRSLLDQHLQTQIDLSLLPADGPPPTHIIWAETAAPFVPSRDHMRRRWLSTAAPEGGSVIVGAVRLVGDGVTEPVWRNGLLALGPEGVVLDAYDKFHLVPFGEYVPFAELLAFAKVATGGMYTPGPGPRTLDLQGLPPFSPLICYEVIFSGEVKDPENQPSWLLNITNDAWYGYSAGPFQHFRISRLRAIEEGLPLVRVANNGISGVFDPYGRVVAKLALDEKGILDTGLPREIESRTVFSRHGELPILFSVVLIATLIWLRKPLIR